MPNGDNEADDAVNGVHGVNGVNDVRLAAESDDGDEVHIVAVSRRKRKKRRREAGSAEVGAVESGSGREGDVEMEESVPSPQSSRARKSKKRKVEHRGGSGSRRKAKRRKFGDKLIRVAPPDADGVWAHFTGFRVDRVRGVDTECPWTLSVHSRTSQRGEHSVSVLQQDVVDGGGNGDSARRCRWRTEVHGAVSAMAVNDCWTVVGTVGGELYWFGRSGRMLLPPVQVDEDVVALSLSPRYSVAAGRRRENAAVHVLAVAADCTLRVWRVEGIGGGGSCSGLEPEQMVRTNFWSVLRMTRQQTKAKDVAMKRAEVTADGKVLLTLSNDFMFVFRPKMDCWLRIVDDGHRLSEERTLSLPNGQREEGPHRQQQQGPTATFSEVLSAMQRGVGRRSVSNLERTRNAESCKMQTISHLEQVIAALTVIGNGKRRERAFRGILMQYTRRLVQSMTLNSLSFAADKLKEIFTILLNAEGKEAANQWPGSVSSQRDLLGTILQSINADHNNNEHNNAALQMIVSHFSNALATLVAFDGHLESL